MKHNYHSHTTFCNHSSWEAEDLIKEAIKQGFETFGISEHIFLPERKNEFRLKSKERTFEYINEVSRLKEKYKDQINVLIGIEVEVNHSSTGKVLLDHIKETSSYPGVEYTIVGHHYYSDSTYTAEVKPTRKLLEDYVNDLETIFKNVKIAYLAHPDLIVQGNNGWDENMEWALDKIIDLSIKYDIPLGININAIYLNKLYPTKQFWMMVGKKGAKAILELDTHSPNSFKQEYIDKAYALAKECNLNLIDKLEIQ